MNIEKARVDLAELDEKRDAKTAELRDMRAAAESEQRDLSDDEARSCEDGFAELDKMDADADKLRSEIEAEEKRDARLKPAVELRQAVPAAEARSANVRGSGKPEMIYRPNNDNSVFFFRDVVNATAGDMDARDRMRQHDAQRREEIRAANTTASTAGGGFVPPIWMGADYAEYAREARPFADVIPHRPLPDVGMTMTVPRITTGTTVATQGSTENTALSSTAIVDSPLSVGVNTIGGYNDVSRQLLDRSDPGIDEIIYSDLRAAYDGYLDAQCLAGSGSSGQHLGIRAVSSINTVSYTDASPTAAELWPKFFDAIQKIATLRFREPTHIVMHPRRAAWLASNLSSTFPLLQQGGLYQGGGQQDGGFALNVGGVPIVRDANILTNYSAGGSTNEDEIYVVYANDLRLYEGPTQVQVDPYTVGLNLTVRITMFAYSAFASARFAASITKLSGSGLSTPSF